jgi:hypothetical protein
VPRVVPSEVVSVIDRLFGSQRNELDTGKILFKHRDDVRTLLSLLDQVPDDLIAVPFADYTEYLQCRSALTSALSGWDALNHGIVAYNVGGKDPIERIRRIFSRCPDENPPPFPSLPLYRKHRHARASKKTYELPGLISGRANGRVQLYSPPLPLRRCCSGRSRAAAIFSSRTNWISST